MSIDELRQIASDREQWAKEAREKDLHGTAKECELTASLARECIASRERYGAVAD